MAYEEPSPERLVRVFVSSTFRDMQHEREVLTKDAFPELRRRCREREVDFVEVDLRWGITAEQAKRGDVVPICLREIDRCRPFFLCLLGDRYGWVPKDLDPSLLEELPWLDEYRGRSVTELEVAHGALDRPEQTVRAAFYLRDPDYSWRDPDSQDPDTGQAAQEQLKKRIAASGHPVRDYDDLDRLRDLVLQDLWQQIDAEFPEDSVPDRLTRERLEHEAFARSRRQVYVGRTTDLDRIDEHVLSDGPPLVVLGESGSGKSALLANWAHRYQERLEESGAPDAMLLHFIGSSAASTDMMSMLERLIRALEPTPRAGGLWRKKRDEKLSDKPAARIQRFWRALDGASRDRRVVLVIDGLDQLEDQAGALDLVWLPAELSPNVRMIFSTLPGRSLEALRQRGSAFFELALLADAERREIVSAYLGRYSKALPPDLCAKVTSADQTSNPLFLRTLLEELRLYGDHDTLARIIRHYLKADSVENLFVRVLDRYESDYEADRPDLVRDAFSLLWASSTGLRETEILDLLGSADSPLPQRLWSPLHLAAEHALVSRAGLLGFGHDYLRKAVQSRYLPDPQSERRVHARLAKYFEERTRYFDSTTHDFIEESMTADTEHQTEGGHTMTAAQRNYNAALIQSDLLRLASTLDERERLGASQDEGGADLDSLIEDRLSSLVEDGRARDMPSYSRRLLEEFIVQASRGHAWESLERRLSSLPFLYQAYDQHPRLVERAWEQLERHTEHRSTDSYRRVIAEPRRYPFYLASVSGLLEAQRRSEHALPLLDALADFTVAEAGINMEFADTANLRFGQALLAAGSTDEAVDAFGRGKRFAQLTRDRHAELSIDCAQALVLRRKECLEAASALYVEVERAARDLQALELVAEALDGQALVLERQGAAIEELRPLYEKEGRLARLTGSPEALIRWLTNWGGVLQAHDAKQGQSLLDEAEGMCRGLGDPVGLARVLLRRAQHSTASSEWEAASAQLREAEASAREAPDAGLLSEVLHADLELLARRVRENPVQGQDESLQEAARSKVEEIRRIGALDFESPAAFLAEIVGPDSGGTARDASRARTRRWTSEHQAAHALIYEALFRLRKGKISARRALKKLAKATAVFREEGDEHHLRWALLATLPAYQHSKRWVDAYDLLEEVVELCRADAGQRDIAHALMCLGISAELRARDFFHPSEGRTPRNAEQLHEAIGWAEKAGVAHEESGNQQKLAQALLLRASMLSLDGEIARAVELAGRAEREFLENGDTEQAAAARELLLLVLDEDIARAAELAGRAEREFLENGDTEQAAAARELLRELLELASRFQATLDALADSQGQGEAELEDAGAPETATETATETETADSEWTLERVLAIDGVSEALDGSHIVNASEISSTASGVVLVLTDGAYPGDRDDYIEVQDVKQRLRALLAPFGIGVD